MFIPNLRGELVIPFTLPGSIPQITVGVADPSHGGDGEADGEVGGVVRNDVGRVDDPDAPIAAPAEVDLVEANAKIGDDLEPRQQVDHLRVRPQGGAAHHRPDRLSVLPQELPPLRRRQLPEAEELEPPVELGLQVRVDAGGEEDAEGFHCALNPTESRPLARLSIVSNLNGFYFPNPNRPLLPSSHQDRPL